MGYLSSILTAAVLFCCGPSLAADKPNVIIILCDDLGYGDLGCYGVRKNRRESIRSGPWKLHLKSNPPQLYHLPTDIAEATDVAGQNPEIVKRLTRLAETLAQETHAAEP